MLTMNYTYRINPTEVSINCHRPIPEGFKVKGVRIVSRVRGTIWYAVVTIQCNVNVPDPLPFGRGKGNCLVNKLVNFCIWYFAKL